MLKVSKILTLIGSILSFVVAASLIGYGILCVTGGALSEFIMKYIEVSPEVDEEMLNAIIKLVSTSIGVSLFVSAVFAILAGVFGMQVIKNYQKKTAIIGIVFAVLGGGEVLIAGLILSLIAHRNDNKVIENQ